MSLLWDGKMKRRLGFWAAMIAAAGAGGLLANAQETVSTDAADVASLLRRQLAVLEPAGGLVDPLEHGQLLGAIRGIVLTIEHVDAKFKYGGNVDVAHRDAIAERLRTRLAPGDDAVLRQLRTQPSSRRAR